MSYRESYSDMRKLIHEIGHIVNAYLSKKNQPFVYEDSTVFAGETASLVNEILLNRYLFRQSSSKDDKIFYLSKTIESCLNQIYNQTMLTEFERLINTKSKEKIKLTPDELSSDYMEIFKKYYSKITDDEHSHLDWTKQSQLYRHSYYIYQNSTGLLNTNSLIIKKKY